MHINNLYNQGKKVKMGDYMKYKKNKNKNKIIASIIIISLVSFLKVEN